MNWKTCARRSTIIGKEGLCSEVVSVVAAREIRKRVKSGSRAIRRRG